jgi:hypothetical protein
MKHLNLYNKNSVWGFNKRSWIREKSKRKIINEKLIHYKCLFVFLKQKFALHGIIASY